MGLTEASSEVAVLPNQGLGEEVLNHSDHFGVGLISPWKLLFLYPVRTARRARDLLKLLQLYPLGLRAHRSCSIAWSASVDGGGGGGRVTIGKNTVLDMGAVLRAGGGFIRMGDDCSVNPYSVLIGGSKGLIIGNGVRIAAHCALVAVNHNFGDPSAYIYLQGSTSKGIVIEDDVWIGAGAKVLDGVTVRKGTVVAAGAVVTKSTERYSVVAGVPARKISGRNALQGRPSSNADIDQARGR